MEQIHIGEIIKQRRMELGLTQEELCEGICESPTLSRIETGRQTPSISKLKAILERLGLPGDKYYAMMSGNELKIESLKNEITSCNMRGCYQEGLEKIDELLNLIDSDDLITKQFILRSRVLLGKIENERIVAYTFQEKLALLNEAIQLTIPNFKIDEICGHWYTINEMKIINQIITAYGDNGERQRANSLYGQFLLAIKKSGTLNNDNVTIAILVAYNHSLYLSLEHRYEEAMEIAEWGWDLSITWARATYMGGFMYVLAESCYHMGKPEVSKRYYFQSYYAYTLVKDTVRQEIIRENILEYFGVDVSLI